MNNGSLGCLVLGAEDFVQELRRAGIAAFAPEKGPDLMECAMRALSSVKDGQTRCVVACGRSWPLGVALSVLLNVDRLVIVTGGCGDNLNSGEEKQIRRWEAFVRRNLFFCVSEVLIVGDGAAEIPPELYGISGAGYCAPADPGKSWRNCEFSPIRAIERFLRDGDCRFPLAK